MSVSMTQTMVDPTNAVNKRTVQSAVVEGRTLELRVGDIDGVQYAWTRLVDSQNGDIIWINQTTDGGNTWNSFGKRTIQAGGRNYTDALRTNSSNKVKMQAWTQLTSGNKYNTAAW
ncbi:hypothetical protein MCAG_03522 [Micromonospora sp. ATCC 39149]|uniref:Uncharacterized protein n=1 Tax=Micromonospora carbonacea TaxID=47853 RepID=A0A7D6CC62_9ACTN|nr:hypothetical protein [Micromonospora sp. ATCC 39149]EEP73195.1 hypothetical protein MCAG_03522 [Micromonospora sp. ATCC 39149]QLJ99225.1 hypothetical protein HZU44_03405 [Micromonospora carbonacea]